MKGADKPDDEEVDLFNTSRRNKGRPTKGRKQTRSRVQDTQNRFRGRNCGGCGTTQVPSLSKVWRPNHFSSQCRTTDRNVDEMNT